MARLAIEWHEHAITINCRVLQQAAHPLSTLLSTVEHTSREKKGFPTGTVTSPGHHDSGSDAGPGQGPESESESESRHDSAMQGLHGDQLSKFDTDKARLKVHAAG